MHSASNPAYAVRAPVHPGALRDFRGRPAKTHPNSFRVYSGTSDNRLHLTAVRCLWKIKKKNDPGPRLCWSEAVLAGVAGPGFEPG
jgi:hypothetical protein